MFLKQTLKNIAKTAKKILNRLLYFIILPFKNKKINLSVDEARKKLETFSNRPTGNSFANNFKPKNTKYDLQIIVPIYNVKDYLKACLDSIFSQKTNYSFQVICIDNGSTDGSSLILESYRSFDNIMIIHKEHGGISSSRNEGLKHIDAKYFMFVDSDDMLCENSIQSLMDIALKENVDIVQGGNYVYKNNVKTIGFKFRENKFVSPINGLHGGVPWGKVYKSYLFSDVCFPEGFFYEDTIFKFIIYPKAKNAYVIKDLIYVYRIREGSIMHISRKMNKCIDSYWITEQLMSENRVNYDNKIIYTIAVLGQFVINTQRAFLTPVEIQESIFVLQIELFKKYCDFNIKLKNRKYDKLMKYLETGNFGKFHAFCKYY